jgi:hypothetical protein
LVVVYKEHRLHHSRAARKAHKLISIRIQEPAQ